MKTYPLLAKKIHYVLATVLCISLFSCEKSEDEDPVEEILPPIVLACDYFNSSQILVNDPQRPVDYVIECWTRVQGSLEIQPGVVIAFEQDAGMLVDLDNQLFEIRGTEQEPVILTGTVQQKGHWRGIYFTEAHNPSNLISNTIIEYAGSELLKSSSPSLGGSLALRNVSGTPPQNLTLESVEISSGGSYGLDLTTNSVVSVSNLTITANEGVPVKVAANKAHLLDQNSTFTGNSSDFVNIVSDNYEIEEMTVSWKQLDVPYLVDGRVHIKEGGHLTIEEGVEILFHPDGYLQTAALLPPYDVSLKILGTASNPVLLHAANGTNWGGIYYAFTQEDNRITHTIIEEAKGDFPVGNLTNSGAIYMHADPRLSVTNSAFNDLPNHAFYAYTGASTSAPDLLNFTRSDNSFTNLGGNELGWGNGRD
ncbi:hypothetical protein SAMN04489724_0265 [Algoriphagus locisalis]|uniref:Right handed beta helix region n=1 Tax=Algoriphagus locisalis TaxID=305507 RepID=A0A1I7E8D5_9BACT|nr:hypothetical protein [Algoriphagus locisalis]SFU20194.1 hypothetical protein SAMN04489724_0265 [Algoriphagus locisalis]